MEKSDEYTIGAKIGDGTHATVYEGAFVASGKIVAVKRINNLDGDGASSTALREVAAMQRLDHPHIVKMRGCWFYPTCVDLVFDYYPCTLNDHVATCRDLRQTRSLNKRGYVETSIRMMIQLSAALAYCHTHDIMHRDISARNVLLDSDCNAYLADFGAAVTLDRRGLDYNSEYVTLWYRAPEVLLGEMQFDCGIDTWALGAVFMHIVCMRALIRCSTIPEQLYKTIEFAGSPHHPDCRWTRGKQLADAVEMRDPMALPPYPYCGKREVPRVPSGFWQCLDVIHKMMALDPHDRPSCAVACQMMVAIAENHTKHGAAEVK